MGEVVQSADSNYADVQERPAQNLRRMRVLLVKAALSAARRFFGERRYQNTRRSRVTAPADLEPPKGLALGFGLGLGSGLGLGWFESTSKVEIDDTRPAQSSVQDAPAQSESPICSI